MLNPIKIESKPPLLDRKASILEREGKITHPETVPYKSARSAVPLRKHTPISATIEPVPIAMTRETILPPDSFSRTDPQPAVRDIQQSMTTVHGTLPPVNQYADNPVPAYSGLAPMATPERYQ